MKNPWVIIGLLATFLIIGSVIYSSSVTSQSNEGVEIKAHVKGDPEAIVKLVEFSDFQCPACASFQPVIKEIMEELGSGVSLEYKHFPLPMHPYAERAARAAEAAGQQDAFFAYHDKLFENQAVWSRSPNPNVMFFQYAEELGLDMEQFKRHLNASALRDKVRAEQQEGRALNVTGTPTFFLNGERMQITTFEDFYNQIVSALSPQVDFSL